jgi:uncharacterized caspase-like protein
MGEHRRRLFGIAFAFAAVLITGAVPAQEVQEPGAAPVLDLAAPAPKRFAVVIGNADYLSAPDLKNARSDAQVVADFLAEAGYQVFEYHDLTKLGFERMLRRVLYDVDKDSEVVFYYAGHGLQIAGGNYLIPADASLANAYDVPFEAVSLTSVVNIIGARARLQMVILDSCRDNPFGNTLVMADLSNGLSETRDGFNVLTAPINSLLSFSTSPGALAYDGAGANSPFTEALVETARSAPERPVGQIFEEVRRLVYERTGGKQVPWESSTLVQPAAFGPPAVAPGPAADDAADAGSPTRSLVLVALPQAMPDAAPAAEAAAGLSLSAPLAREVGIGASLADALGADPATPVEITAPPQSGRLVLRRSDGLREDAARAGVTGATLGQLIYVNEADPVSAATAPVPVLTDSFTVASAGSDETVKLTLEADPCDRAAGDHLDPEGVGVARYPNEIEPEAAREACLQAVAAYPEVGRFHYQLGRAELALRNFDAARAEFEQARELGHTRAWYALGALIANQAATTGGKTAGAAPPEALALYRTGVERGDPYAFHALGKQLLRYGQNDAERREGFDLLTRALELGHTFAMNELGAYYVDPDSPFSDPARGLRYWQESADRSDIYGYNNLGLVYLNGEAGVAKDPQAAFEWFRKAADGGHPQAPGNIGRLWNSGALGETDRYSNAVEWYDIGLERGDAWSGANAAWIIANHGLPGLSLRDAAVRAAKAAALRDEDAAAEARGLLAGLPPEAVDGAAQQLINELGGQVGVDGAFGPASVAALQQAIAAAGTAPPTSDTPADRAIALAQAYWATQKFRVDLY